MQKFKNLNHCIRVLKDGGYMVEYQNYQGSGIRGSLAGTGLQNKDGRCELTECRSEFIHLRDQDLIKPVEWESECKTYSGVEWRWSDDKAENMA